MMRRFMMLVGVLMLCTGVLSAQEGSIVTPEGEVLNEQPAQEPAPKPEPAAQVEPEKKDDAPITIPTDWPTARSRQFGLGFLLGAPTGLSFRWFFHDMQGIDALAAWSWGYDHHSRVLFHADYLFRFYVVPIPKGDGSLYTGGGLRVGAYDDNRWEDHDPSWSFLFGLRVPGGIMYQAKAFPIEVLLEIAFVIDILPAFWPGFDIGLSLRVCF